MSTFSNSPIPREDPAKVPAEDLTPTEPPKEPAETAEAAAPALPAEESTDGEVQAAEEAVTSEGQAPEAAEGDTAETQATATEAEASPDGEAAPQAPQKPQEPPMPWAIVVRHFAHAPAEAYKKLNTDFGLSLDGHGYARLQKLFRTVLKRDPTAGELCLLDALDRETRDLPRREALGELYTDPPAIAETWADMMAKHTELFAAAGLLRKERRVPPPCTFEEALTLIGRYLYRAGLVTPLSDGLPFGGKNSDGRTAVLCSPAREADAIAEGYALVRRVELGTATRSIWVRRGPAMAVTPEKSGDFLVCLHAPDPTALASVLEGERKKSRPAVGAVAALSSRSPLETVLTLCEGADLYPVRLPRAPEETCDGPAALLRLCRRPGLAADTRPGYLLRVPVKKVRELSETLRAAGIVAVSVGQVKSGGRVRVLMRQGDKDIPVANLAADTIRAYPATALYRRRAEAVAAEAVAPAVVLPLPEEGLLMAASEATVTREGTGYATAMETVSAAVAPLTEGGVSTRDIRLSVKLTASDGEGAHGSRALEILCGLYRAAAEGGMAVEDPVFTVKSPAEGQEPAVYLSVAAYRRA